MDISFVGAGDYCIAAICNRICLATVYIFILLKYGRFHSSGFAKWKQKVKKPKIHWP